MKYIYYQEMIDRCQKKKKNQKKFTYRGGDDENQTKSIQLQNANAIGILQTTYIISIIDLYNSLLKVFYKVSYINYIYNSL